jgi:NADP-dependent 3-hydroxy acid dehydrogenase YdfG
MTLSNKVVLITGASAGIGKELTIKLAKQGCNLAICGRTKEKLQDTIKYLNIPPEKLYSECFSITNQEQSISFIQNTIKKFGKIDILINNAGANTKKDLIVDISTEDFDYMHNVNFRAPFIFMKEVGKQMIKQKSGTVINILSSTCKFAVSTMGSYTSTKSGLEALTDVYRKEMRPHGIKTCSVYPGGVDSDFRKLDRPDYMKAESSAETIISTLLLPDDVAVHDLTFRPMIEENFS